MLVNKLPNFTFFQLKIDFNNFQFIFLEKEYSYFFFLIEKSKQKKSRTANKIGKILFLTEIPESIPKNLVCPGIFNGSKFQFSIPILFDVPIKDKFIEIR